MYHRTLNILVVTQDAKFVEVLRAVKPLDGFSHQFVCGESIEVADICRYAIVILDFECVGLDRLAAVCEAESGGTIVVGCVGRDDFSHLAESYDYFSRIWMKPFVGAKVRAGFAGVLKQIKEREDCALTSQYLDTLIDSLPNLIWFKDARGAHLKVNESFCRAVNKTKEQVEGRGHYYIWDIEPDEYAQGEYICLESEEIVLEKKETCLFDETVKFGGKLHKFKTYKSPIFDTDGEVIGTVGFANDVTDLQNLMIELNIMVESLPFAVMVTDKDRVIASVNQNFIDNFKLDRKEVHGKPVDSLLDETKMFTKSRRWILEDEEDYSLLVSKEKVLKIHEETIVDVFGAPAGYIYIFMDITIEYNRKDKLLVDANTDHLTGLNNRRKLHDFMREAKSRKRTTLLLADLDNFKEVNDRFGHDEGDRVLVAFSKLLQELFPAEGLFRLGGDEFAIILHDVESLSMSRQYAEQLLKAFNDRLGRQFSHTKVSVSIGVSMDNDDNCDFGELFKKADMALYESKNAGKSAYTIYGR